MYMPAAFRVGEISAAHAIMRDNSFASLISTDDTGLPFVSFLPFHLEAAEGPNGTLYAHMARPNPQWRHFARPVLVSFMGPHGYISPSWYENPRNVPTWNYVGAQAYGTAIIDESEQATREILAKLVAAYEGPDGWKMAEVDDAYVRGLMRGIVAFRIPIERLEAKAKLSQNKPTGDLLGAAQGLERGTDPVGHQLAKLMRESLP